METYFALLTPPGRGGIAVLRLQGPEAIRTLQEIFRPSKKDVEGFEQGRICYGHVFDADGRLLDEVIVSVITVGGPCEAVDVNCHGGSAAVRAIALRLEQLGLKRRSADELNSLVGASPIIRSALRLLPLQATELAARMLLDQLNGALEAQILRIVDLISEGNLPDAEKAMDMLLSRWQHTGQPLTQPRRVVIAGGPNAGKSTLVNALVGAERVITSPTPGTTRDYVEAIAAIAGVPITLIDTAGLAEAKDLIEQLSIEQAKDQVKTADVVVWLLDGARGITPEDERIMENRPASTLLVWNKMDASAAPEDLDADLAISALTGQNLDLLGSAILELIEYEAAAPQSAIPFVPEQAYKIATAKWLLGRNIKGARDFLLDVLGQTD